MRALLGALRDSTPGRAVVALAIALLLVNLKN